MQEMLHLRPTTSRAVGFYSIQVGWVMWFATRLQIQLPTAIWLESWWFKVTPLTVWCKLIWQPKRVFDQGVNHFFCPMSGLNVISRTDYAQIFPQSCCLAVFHTQTFAGWSCKPAPYPCLNCLQLAAKVQLHDLSVLGTLGACCFFIWYLMPDTLVLSAFLFDIWCLLLSYLILWYYLLLSWYLVPDSLVLAGCTFIIWYLVLWYLVAAFYLVFLQK